MDKTMQPIETVYNGYRFRSRLEARWAVFFDALGVEYEYEKEGYDLGEYGWYLPDFWFPKLGCWAEIKKSGGLTKDETLKCKALCDQTSAPILAISGQPWVELTDGLELINKYTVTKFIPFSRWLGQIEKPSFECDLDRNSEYMKIHLANNRASWDKETRLYCAEMGYPLPSSIDGFADKVIESNYCIFGVQDDGSILLVSPFLEKARFRETRHMHAGILMEGISGNNTDEERIGALLLIAQGEYLAELNKNEAIRIRDWEHGVFGKLMTNAYNAARQARFEHGEVPVFTQK